MARQAITAAGYVAGFFLPGGPAVWGTIGAVIGNAVDPQVIKGPRLGEGQENFAAEGGFRPIVLGKGAVGVCLIHQGPLIKRTIRQRQSKGGGPVTEEQRAYRTMAFALGESADPENGVGLLRLWIDGKLRYDVTPTSQIPDESAEFSDQFTFYPGNNAQNPDPDLEAFMGAGNVPSYRGGAPYIVFPNYDVTSSSGRAPQIKAELSYGTSSEVIEEEYDGGQSFPAEFIIPVSSGPGIVDFDFWVGSAPDKLEILINDVVVYDTGYVGNASLFQTQLDDNLDGRGLPPEPIGPGNYQIDPDPSVSGGVSYGVRDTVEKPTGVTSVKFLVWGPLPQTGWTVNGRIVTGGTGTGPVPLSYIIDFLHDRTDSKPSGVAELTDDVEGVVFAGDYTAADAIRTFMTLYFFDAGEFDAGTGYKINYVKRGGDAVTTLTEDDIIEGPEDWEREDSYERPRVLHLSYPNPIADYGAPNIVIKRTSPDVLVVGERSVSVPVVFSDATEITQRADIMMTVIYTEIAGTYEIVLPDRLIELAPTNSIGFSIRGKIRRLRMTGWRYGEGVIRTEWVAERQSAYTSDVTGLPAIPSTLPPPSIVGDTVAVVMDIPALSDTLDNLHLPVAATGQTEAWWGATQQRKLESDTSFTNVAAINPPGSVMGVLDADVGAASAHYTDTTNKVTVELYSDDEIETLTQAQFLSEGGAFALSWDDSGTRRWELMQYRDAVKVGDRTWELSYLARGRLNTVAAEHLAGAVFVLLDYGVTNLPMQSAWIDTEITHRTVSNGQSPDSAIPYAEEWTAQCQTEFPVAHLFAEIAGDDLNLSCVPRHRFGTEDNPIRSANWTGYRWTATDGSNAAQVDTIADTATIDVTSWSTPITVTVAQLNRYTGAGPTVTEDVS